MSKLQTLILLIKFFLTLVITIFLFGDVASAESFDEILPQKEEEEESFLKREAWFIVSLAGIILYGWVMVKHGGPDGGPPVFIYKWPPGPLA